DEPAAERWSPPVPDRPAPAADDERSVAYDEPVVEGEAVELPADEAQPPLYERSAPDPMPFPVAEEPVAVITPGSSEPTPATPLAGSAEAYASGHAAAPGPSWQEPVMELANERPELVVAAAFAGGVLAALILRRLGN
ncbi:MAG: hypothetical protein ACRDLN_07275, partial [Solirubrobacteraceae bacterium]